MARTKLDALLSDFDGHLGNLVFYSVGKRVYARRYVKPANPKTEDQEAHRSLFAEAMASWKHLSAEEKQVYKKKAKKRGRYGHNIYVKEYIKLHKQKRSV